MLMKITKNDLYYLDTVITYAAVLGLNKWNFFSPKYIVCTTIQASPNSSYKKEDVV